MRHLIFLLVMLASWAYPQTNNEISLTSPTEAGQYKHTIDSLHREISLYKGESIMITKYDLHRTEDSIKDDFDNFQTIILWILGTGAGILVLSIGFLYVQYFNIKGDIREVKQKLDNLKLIN